MRLRSRMFIIALSRSARHLTTILTAVLLVRIVSKETYGTYRQVVLVATFLMSLLGTHLSQGLYYFTPKLGPSLRRLVLSQTLLMTIVVAGIAGAVMYVGADGFARWFGNPDLALLFRLVWLLPMFILVLRLAPPFMISLDRASRAGIYTLLEALVRMAPLVVLLGLGFSLATAMVGFVACALLAAVIAVCDMYGLSPGGERSFDRRLAREQVSYVLPLMAAVVVGVVGRQFDKFLISTFFEPQDFAIYACGAIRIPAVDIVTGSVASSIMPNMVTMATGGGAAAALALWKRAASKTSLLVYPVFAICALCAADIIVLLFTEAYALARGPFLIYLFELPVQVIVFGTLLRALGRTRPVAVGSVIALVVNASVSLALIYLGRDTILAFLGPSIGTVVGIWTAAIYLLNQIRIVTGVHLSKLLPWKRLWMIMGLSVVAGLITMLIPLQSFNVAVRLGIRVLIYAVLLAAALFLTGSLEPDEKEVLMLPFRWLRKGRPESHKEGE